MAFFITQTHKWKLLQLRPRLRSNVRSSNYCLYSDVLCLCAVLSVLVIAAMVIRKAWTILQKVYFTLITWWKKRQRKKTNQTTSMQNFQGRKRFCLRIGLSNFFKNFVVTRHEIVFSDSHLNPSSGSQLKKSWLPPSKTNKTLFLCC